MILASCYPVPLYSPPEEKLKWIEIEAPVIDSSEQKSSNNYMSELKSISYSHSGALDDHSPRWQLDPSLVRDPEPEPPSQVTPWFLILRKGLIINFVALKCQVLG